MHMDIFNVITTKIEDSENKEKKNSSLHVLTLTACPAENLTKTWNTINQFGTSYHSIRS